MIRKIVIAPDSFKGCLSAADVAEACLRAVRSVAPGCEVVKLPVADGGEGTSRAVTEATGGNFVQCQVCDPLMRPVTATYGISPDGTTAYMEMAQASGIALLDADELNPMETTSFGTGQMILDAIRRGCSYIILGIGGAVLALVGGIRAFGYKKGGFVLVLLGLLFQIGMLITACVAVEGFSFLLNLCTIVAIILLVIATVFAHRKA